MGVPYHVVDDITRIVNAIQSIKTFYQSMRFKKELIVCRLTFNRSLLIRVLPTNQEFVLTPVN